MHTDDLNIESHFANAQLVLDVLNRREQDMQLVIKIANQQQEDNRKLYSENQQLRSDKEQLCFDNQQLRSNNEQLQVENQQLRNKQKQDETIIIQQAATIQELEQIIANTPNCINNYAKGDIVKYKNVYVYQRCAASHHKRRTNKNALLTSQENQLELWNPQTMPMVTSCTTKQFTNSVT